MKVLRVAVATCTASSLTSCGGGVISSEDVTGGQAVAIAVVIVVAFIFIGAVITRKK